MDQLNLLMGFRPVLLDAHLPVLSLLRMKSTRPG
jgi:hypothetical protein